METRRDWSLAIIIAIVVLCCFLPTIEQEVAWYDSAETVVAALRLDIPHQPGYPIYTLIAALWLRLFPFSSAAAKLSILATLCTALAASFIFISIKKEEITKSSLSGLVAVSLLAFAPIVWNSSIVCEVYTFELLLLSLAFWSVTSKHKYLSPLLMGMALCHRTSALALAPALLLYFGKESAQNYLAKVTKKEAIVQLALFFLPFVAYGYVYWRLEDPSLVIADPKTPKTLSTLFSYWSCADYRHALFPFGFLEMLVRVKHLLLALGKQFPLVSLLFIGLGYKELSANRPNLLRTLLYVIFVNGLFVAGYAAMEADTMMLPSIVALSVLAGCGFERLLPTMKLNWARGVAILLILWTASRGHLLIDRDRLKGSQRFMEQISTLVPKGGHLLLSNDVSFRPYLYSRYVENFRSDLAVTVIDKLDGSNEASLDTMVRTQGLIGPLLHPRNLYSHLREKYFLRPYGPVYHILPNVPNFVVAATKPVAFRIGAKFDNGLQLFGWQVGLVGQKEPMAGNLVTLTYRWFCMKATKDPVMVVLLFANERHEIFCRYGVTAFHNIHRPCYGYRDTNSWIAGEHYEESHVVLIPPDIPKGKWTMWLAMTSVNDAGMKRLELEELANVNYLNYDGTEQVFRLTYGQRIGEPFYGMKRLRDLDEASVSFIPVIPSGARMLRLGELPINK